MPHPPPQSDALETFLRDLPKAELHLHLEGAVPWERLRTWSEAPLPAQPPWWDRDHRFASFGEFVTAMRGTWRGYLNSPERITETAQGAFASLVAQNVRYVEISFGLGAYSFPVGEVVAAIKQGEPPGLNVRVFAGISRDRDLDWMLGLAREAVEADGLDGIDLHGDERAGRLEDFTGIYEVARERGLVTKAHAGELGGARSVRETVEVLGVARIEHGFRAAENLGVVDFLRDRGVMLDLCPWSNVKLQVVSDLAGHPLRVLHGAGIRVTVNTDDPTVFGQSLTDELRWLVTEMGLRARDVAAIAGNGFRAALIPAAERERYLGEIAEVADLAGRLLIPRSDGRSSRNDSYGAWTLGRGGQYDQTDG